MIRYIQRRALQTLVTLLMLSLAVFLLARVLGDPVTFMLPLDASAEEVERLRKMFGFDLPLHEQYAIFLSDLLKGDLGISVRNQEPVLEIILERLWPSVSLALVSLFWAGIVSIGLGTLAAVNHGRLGDRIANLIAIIGQSAPSFWIGLMAVQVFAVQLGVLPAAGKGSLAHYVLPSLTLGLVALAGLTRLLRSSMLEVLHSDYITKARITGISERRVIFKHALRNALLPILTYAGELFAALIAAAVAVEVVFAWPGIGRLAFEAVFTRDYPVIQGVVIVIAAIVMLINLGVDLLYAFIDPRIRYS